MAKELIITQGQNDSIQFEFDEDMTDIPKISIGLYAESDGKLIKHWDKNDVTISEKIIFAPVTQKESSAFPGGNAEILVKVLNAASQVIFYESLKCVIKKRKDRGVIF